MTTALSLGTLTNFEVIDIPERAVVHEHKESKAKFTAFPFVFPDGYPATIVVTRGTKSKWRPADDIKRIIIEFTD